MSFPFDSKALGLHDESTVKDQTVGCRRVFLLVGRPPHPAQCRGVQQKTLPGLGAPDDKEWLKRVIQETIGQRRSSTSRCPPTCSICSPGLSRSVVWWRESKAGGTTTALVRLKNTSQRPLIVPTGNPRDENATQPFEIDVRQGAGPWRGQPGGDPCEHPRRTRKKAPCTLGGRSGVEQIAPW